MSEFEKLVEEARNSVGYWKGKHELAEQRFEFIKREHEKLSKRVRELEIHVQEAVELMTQEQLNEFNKIVSDK